MRNEPLATALEREHHEIDAGIETFMAAPADRRALTEAVGELRRHIYVEEEILFPLLREAEPALGAPVSVMLREHAQICDTLDALEQVPDEEVGAALALGKQLAVQLLHHNLKEERILYPLADGVLTPDAEERLNAFEDTRELPEGWACRHHTVANAIARAVATVPET